MSCDEHMHGLHCFAAVVCWAAAQEGRCSATHCARPELLTFRWLECDGTGGCATAAAFQGCVLAWKAVLLYYAVRAGNTLFLPRSCVVLGGANLKHVGCVVQAVGSPLVCLVALLLHAERVGL